MSEQNTTNPNKFYGNINEDMTLADIFQTLGVNQQYGWLFLKYLSQQICLYFQGDLVSLVTRPEEKLQYIPEKLYYAGKLAPEAYENILHKENRYEALQQAVPPEDVDNILNTICYEEICNTFGWEQGYFEFIPQSHPEANPEWVPIGRMFEVRGILMEVVQRQQDSQEMEQEGCLPAQEEILMPNAQLDVDYPPDDPMGNIWRLANNRSLKEILLLSYFSAFDTYRIVSSFIRDGKLRLIADEEIRSQAAIFEGQGNWAKASEYHQLLLKRNPLDISAVEALIPCYANLGQEEATKALYRNTGNCLLASTNFKERTLGGGYLKKFSDMSSESAEGIEVRITLFYAVVNQQVDAKTIEYNIILEGKKLFQMLRNHKDDQRARQILQTILQISPHDKYLQSQLINVSLDLGDVGSAIAQYEAIAKIYERDKNWAELASTYQKIIRLAPARKDIQKRLEIVQRKSTRGKKKILIPVAVAVLLALFAGAGFGYQKFFTTPAGQPSDNNTTNPNKTNPDNENGLRKILEEKAKKKLALAREDKKQGRFKEARDTLKELTATSLPEEIKKEIEDELGIVEKLLAEYNQNVEEFKKMYAEAESLKNEKQWKQAIETYLSVWRNDRFKNVPNRDQIKLPIYLKVFPKGATVSVDGRDVETLTGDDKAILVHPEFKEIKVSLKGYSFSYYYNSFAKADPKPINDEHGNVLNPLSDGTIEIKLPKKVLWQLEFSEQGKGVAEATPILFKDTLYVSCRDDLIHAFQTLKSGETAPNLWSIKVGNISSFSASPVCHNNVLYIGGNNAYFYALDIKQNPPSLLSHYKLRKNSLVENTAAISASNNLLVFSYVTFGREEEGHLYALPLLETASKTWQPLWMFATKEKIESGPVVAESRVLIGGHDGYLYCLDVQNGTLLWKYNVNKPVYCTPTVENNIVYIAGNDLLRAIKLENKKELWKTQIVGVVNGRPVIKNGVVYLATGSKKVYAISAANGEIVWQYDAAAPFKASPAISNKDIVYIGTRLAPKETGDKTSILYALQAKNGQVMWTYEFSKDLFASPVLAGDLVLQASDKLYAFMDN